MRHAAIDRLSNQLKDLAWPDGVFEGGEGLQDRIGASIGAALLLLLFFSYLLTASGLSTG